MSNLPPRFNFKEADEKWSQTWEEKNVFHAKVNPKKESFTVVIPPPNVTGILHMGHALNNTLQDIIVRYKRMKGVEACWMPGTDHAGIATQNVVEKQLAKEGKNRHDIGRDELLKRLWAWKDQYGDTIINQLKKLGASCDWPRTRFTMDEGYSEAVREVFVHLHRKGLIYRGQRIINWCPRCQTALSDEEAEHEDHQGALYHIRYPFKEPVDGHEALTVATTRPETMLGDTAVAVNPNDQRYKDLIGKTLILPVVNREIPIIADDFVNPEFGTGAVKVTPAHDPNDFEMGQRHNLEFINIMHPDGRLNEKAGEDFDGQDRFEAREALVENLKKLKLLVKIEEHNHAVGHCYRCHTVIEPYLSKQWFVKMKPLAEPALRAVREGKITFYPDRWTKVYTNWMEDIRDWCISRQIWWGHRIPVWYDDEDNLYVAKNEATARKAAKEERGKDVALRQDPDVLDTWFSSWLWPFATFGWPQKSKDLEYFYPGDVLFTASEIIFFWVARMIMAGYEFMGDLPFSRVYIHGTVRDSQGRKMSKSLGNAIDPLEIISEYGADALRFSLIMNSGQDLYVSKEKFELGRNFANKIWNASRLVLMKVSKEDRTDFTAEDLKNADLPSRWILAKFYATLKEIERSIEAFRYSEAENLLYDFFWNTYCDWYVEIIKDKFDQPLVRKTAFHILEKSVRMLHPFMPFVTEEIWSYLKITDRCLAVSEWPEIKNNFIDADVIEQMGLITELVSAVRNIKAQWGLKPRQPVDCLLAPAKKEDREVLTENAEMIKFLLNIRELEFHETLTNIKNAAVGVIETVKFCLPLEDVIDIESEKSKILEQIAEHREARGSIQKRLENKNFVEKAPEDVIEKDRNRLKNLDDKITELDTIVKNLE